MNWKTVKVSWVVASWTLLAIGCSREPAMVLQPADLDPVVSDFVEESIYQGGLHEIRNAEGDVFLKVGCLKRSGSPVCIRTWLDASDEPVDPKVALRAFSESHRELFKHVDGRPSCLHRWGVFNDVESMARFWSNSRGLPAHDVLYQLGKF